MVFMMSFSKRSGRPVALMAVALLGLLSVAVAPATGQAQDDAEAAAQTTDPVVVVTLGSINKLTQDVNYLTGAVGQAQAGGMFNMMAVTFTQGVDTTRPIGVIVPLVDGVPQPIGLIPTSDVKTVLKRLEAQTGPADELDDGTLVVAFGASTIFIRQADQWAVVAPRRDLLDVAPADPSELFKGLGNNYDLGVRLRMQRVPEQMRQMLTQQMRFGFESAMQRQQGADVDSTRQVAENTIKQLEQIINETDQVTFGINIDQQEKQVEVDVAFTAVPNTDLAAMYGSQVPVPSQFSSVIRPDAAGYYHAAVAISPEAVDQVRTNMDGTMTTIRNALKNNNLTPSQQAEIEDLIDRVMQLAVKSMAEGRADVGALLLANEEQFRFVFGSFVADGSEAAAIVKDLAKKVENEENAPTFKFDIDTYKEVALHAVEAEVPESEDEARAMFGETLRVHIGTGPKAVYVAVGKNSLELMKELIDKAGSDKTANRPAGQLNVKLLPILQYAQSIESNDTLTAMIDALTRAEGDGEITLVQESIPNGQETEFTIGEGVLRAIGAASRQAQQLQQGEF